jgi:hypothetical protein
MYMSRISRLAMPNMPNNMGISMVRSMVRSIARGIKKASMGTARAMIKSL